MKNEGALRMRFLRHDGIYRSDVSSLLFTPGACPAFRSGRCQGIGQAGKNLPCPSSAMSSGRLFLDRVARLHCPSPLHRHVQHKTIARSKGMIYYRTANSLLTVCLTRGDKRTGRILQNAVEERPAKTHRGGLCGYVGTVPAEYGGVGSRMPHRP